MVRGNKYALTLAEAIVRPFTDTSLDEKEVLFEYARAYRELLQYDYIGSSRRTEVKTQLKRAEEDVRCFFENSYWIHLDDLYLAVEYLYPPYELESYIDDSGIGRFYLNHIYRIASCFITFRDGRPSIRNWSKKEDSFLPGYSEYDKIELWNNISRSCTTDLFIAAIYVRYKVKPENMFNIPDIISLSDMPLERLFYRGVAETHMHANAGLAQNFLWNRIMTHRTFDKDLFYPISKGEFHFCRLFRMLVSDFIEHSECDQRFLNYCKAVNANDIVERLFGPCIKEDCTCPKTYLSEYEKEFYNRYDALYEEGGEDILLRTVYYSFSKRHISGDILMYYYVLNRLMDMYDSELCSLFMRYIRIKNKFYSKRIQQTRVKGLDYFQKIYNAATDVKTRDKIAYYYSIIEDQSKTGNLRILEMKITPKISKTSPDMPYTREKTRQNTVDQLKSIFQAYSNYINDYLAEHGDTETIQGVPQLGLIYHFIKEEDSDNFTGCHCPYGEDAYLATCSDYLSMRKQSSMFLEVLRGMFQGCPILSDYVIGIDAASIENKTEPWVFAPVFRKARERSTTVPYSAEKPGNIQNIGFTYHVGEDFRHIASGLRHIDEVLDYFDYHSGDRIGHAIALGIDIDYWAEQNGMVAVPALEYLENLLWTWRYTQMGKSGFSSGNIEFKIMELARSIFGEYENHIDIYMLWRVYQDKFKDDIDFTRGKCTLIEDSNPGELTYKKLINRNYCPCYYEHYHRPVFVSTREYIDLYKELQKYLISKIEKKGIYVESNPSSNTAISDIHSIFDHPVLRLNNKGLSIKDSDPTAVLISINSDDPVVFSTYAENELSYIYYELLNAGCGREEALEWIDKIRLHGINSSFIKHEKNITEIKDDLKIILEYFG